MTTPSEGWAAKTNTIVAIAGLLFVLFTTVATVAMYQGRIEEKVNVVDKRLERMEGKLDLIAPPTVRMGYTGPQISAQPVASVAP